MNKSGVRSAVRVIRLDEFTPRVSGAPRMRAEQEPETDWSSLPAVNWPDPIGSDRLRAPVIEVPTAAPHRGQDETTTADLTTSAALAASAASASPGRASTGEMPRLPYGVVTSWPLRFHGVASDYARLWLVSALLTLVTAGLYLPWARARSQRYLMRQTHVAGHVLDYHEPALHMLPRHLLAWGLVLGVAGAWAGSDIAGMLALSLALAVWPLLVFMSLTHRLAHISWAHRRLAFDARCQDVYRAMWAPLACGGAVAWLGMTATVVHSRGSWLAWGAAVALWLLGMPGFVWTWYLFRQRHLRLGPLRLLWKAQRLAVMMMFLRTLVWAMLATGFSLGLCALVVAGVLIWRGGLDVTVRHVLSLGMVVSVCAVVQPYAQARLQNLVWSKSGNRYLRFRSKLSVSGYVALQCKHALLLVITMGLYWPWAVIATRRMRTQALAVWSRVDADVLKAHWPRHAAARPGKMAGSPARPRR